MAFILSFVDIHLICMEDGKSICKVLNEFWNLKCFHELNIVGVFYFLEIKPSVCLHIEDL